MSIFNILPTLSRLSICNTSPVRNISINASPLYFKVTDALLGEPLKKKKRLDPAILRQREERRRKKIEKQIRRLEKVAKQLKPLIEVEIPIPLIDDPEPRERNLPPLSEEEIERRALLEKEWARYKLKQYKNDLQMMDTVLYSQQRALDELKAESEELYLEAVQIDPAFMPHKTIGPTYTPPIEDYQSPDGEYIDITRKFEGE